MGAPVLTGQVCLGGASLSLLPDFPEEEAVAVIRAAADAGVRVFDSARAYAPLGNPTHNEALFAQALADRDGSLIGTKGGHFRTGPRTWEVDNSPERLRRDVDDSLRTLRVEQIGLYYLHRADGPDRFRGSTGDAPSIGDSVAALADMRQAGKLAGIGLSNVTVAQLDEAAQIVPIAAVQNPLTVGGRGDAVLLRRCEELDVAYFAYAPLRGVAIGEEAIRRFPATARLAQRRGVSVQRLLMRGLLASSPALSVVVGASSKATAVDSAGAMTERWEEESQAAYDADLTGGGSLR